MGELDFIFNKSKYGGVWHVVENLVATTFGLEKTTRIGGDGRPYWVVREAAIQFEGDPICHQGGKLIAGGRDWGHWENYGKPDETLIFKAVKQRLYAHGIENMPMPLCTRCARKAGINLG